MKRVLIAVLALCFCLSGCGDYGPSTEEVREEAYREGYSDGHDDGYLAGYDYGWNDGWNDGYNGGYDDGYSDGTEGEAAAASFDISDLEWQDTPDSTAFSRIGYAAGYKVLGVVFRNSDPRIYLYYDFPQSEWDSFRTAESWGGYYNEHIKGQYESERID